jgi:NodT family efflux transporter outer membrane factor (OMF) lipoprotein
MRLLIISLLSTALLLPGCIKVGPDYIPPPTPVADNWLETDSAKLVNEQDSFEEWWTVFNDPVLNGLVEGAYAQNLSLQVAGLRVIEARAQLGIATGRFYPQIQQLNAGAATVGGSRHAANSIGGDLNFKDVTSSLDAAWELDFWGKFRRGIEAADAGYLASIADYENVMVTLTAEVARVYIVIRTLEDRINLAKESVSTQKRSLEIVESRFEGGLVTELDVQQARSLLANTQASIPRFEAEYQRAQHALSVLLGDPPADLSTKLAEQNEIVGAPRVPAKVAVGIPAELLRRRPDVRRAELQAAAQSALIGVAKADLLPHFTLIGSIGLKASKSPLTREGGSDLNDLFDSDSMTYFAGPSLSWDLFNYGRIKNQVRVQDARFQQTVVNYQNTVLRAAQETEDAMVGFLRDQEQVGFLNAAVAASRRSVELATLQYREGLTDYQRVLDSQRGLTSDRDRLADVRGSIALNLVAMYKALGGGWQVRQPGDFIPASMQKEMTERTNWGGLLDP